MSRFRFTHCLLFAAVAISALSLVGCGASGPIGKARADRALAVQKKITQRQRATFSESGPNTVRGIASREYVGNRRWMIFPKSHITESEGNRIIAVGLREFGTATALTEDGYFLTAAHVVSTDVPAALNKMDTRPARIVKLLPGADLAVIKFPFKVSHRFDQLATKVSAGDRLFSDAAKGKVRMARVAPWKNGVRSIECHLPSAPGQSGGPVCNSEGELVGVIVAVYQMRLTRRITDTAIVNMVEPQVLRKIIEDDRRAQASKR